MLDQRLVGGRVPLLALSLVPLLALAGAGRAHQAVDPGMVAQVEAAPEPTLAAQAELIEEGERLFFEETFGGNGRTCGTCHRDDNNYTIDPKFIAGLPADDPLFVAEFTPMLRTLEDSGLLRRFGLVTENLDGFDQSGVLRSVPHTLGMTQSLKPPADGPFPLREATGWSGDGAPGGGTLREFAIGAVIQHLTKDLARRPGIDFRLPTKHELRALLAFQLSIGRADEVRVDPGNSGALVFADRTAERGRVLFHGTRARGGGTRACAECHVGAGANGADGAGGMFATGVELLPTAPACRSQGRAPGDGGFGKAPVTVVKAHEICGPGARFDVTFRGAQTFNAPSLIEAADTAPFFHNNAVATLEDAVAFYATDTFDRSPAGEGRAFVLSQRETRQIAAFLRAVNLVENAREAINLIGKARGKPPADAGPTILEARANALDAIEVLADSPVPLFTAPRPARLFSAAARKLQRAAANADPTLLRLAEQDLARARSLVAPNAK
jgi:cytochrome c peroxidase